MRRMPIRDRVAPLAGEGGPSPASCGISPDFSGLSLCHGQVAYVLLTRAPVAGGRKQASCPAAPRLACVKPVASVHPEPGSNSSLLLSCFFFFSEIIASRHQGHKQRAVCPTRPGLRPRPMNRLFIVFRIDEIQCPFRRGGTPLSLVLLRLLQIFQCSL